MYFFFKSQYTCLVVMCLRATECALLLLLLLRDRLAAVVAALSVGGEGWYCLSIEFLFGVSPPEMFPLCVKLADCHTSSVARFNK